jgi:hypothetical protein
MTIYTTGGKVIMNGGKAATSEDCCCCGQLTAKGLLITISGVASTGCYVTLLDGSNSQKADMISGINGTYTAPSTGEGSWAGTLGTFMLEEYAGADCSGTPTPVSKTVTYAISCTGNKVLQIAILAGGLGTDLAWRQAGMELGVPYTPPTDGPYQWLTAPTITLSEAS